jgi:hypothetical protein
MPPFAAVVVSAAAIRKGVPYRNVNSVSNTVSTLTLRRPVTERDSCARLWVVSDSPQDDRHGFAGSKVTVNEKDADPSVVRPAITPSTLAVTSAVASIPALPGAPVIRK